MLGAIVLVGVGCNVVLGIDPAVPCAVDTDCPVEVPECSSATCEAGQCTYQDVIEGTRLKKQEPNDCQQVVCNGAGNVKVEPFDDADDQNPCTFEECKGGIVLPSVAITGLNVSCYSGDKWTRGIGMCREGTIQCNDGQPTGKCDGEVLPREMGEVCLNGIDDDCDGSVDENFEGCTCGDGKVTPEIGEECDDGAVENGPSKACSSQCTLFPCQSGMPLTLAIDQLFLGDVNPDGTANPTNGWKNYGFNLDGLVSTKTSTDLCMPRTGASKDAVHSDGPDGIDNAFGKNILPLVLSLASNFSDFTNDQITSGMGTHLYAMANVGQTACRTQSASFHGSGLGKAPAFDGSDAWPIDPSSLLDPNFPPYLSSARAYWGDTKIINGRVTTGNAAQFDLVLDTSMSRITLPIRNARLEFQVSQDHKHATSGILGGIIRTEDFVNEFSKVLPWISKDSCDPNSPTLQLFQNMIRQASDIMENGGQNPNAECDGISIGLGFTMKAVQLGSVADPAKPPPDPCLPTPLCTGESCHAPSCNNSPAPQACGASSNENCCISPIVPGGTYNRSNDQAYPATISDFYLDRFEVTVGRFRKFVEAYPGSKPIAGAGNHAKIPGSGWTSSWSTNLPADKAALMTALKCQASFQTWTDAPSFNEYLPINCITWYEAFAFCSWDGGRLPTEAEWNYAAAGGTEQWPYPWGFSALDSNHAVFGCQGDGQCTLGDIPRVGSKSPIGDGRWGQADLSGNMWEWTLDRYQSPYATPCVDCANLQNGSDRVTRGGDWSNSNLLHYQTQFRYVEPEPARRSYFGFRCARNP